MIYVFELNQPAIHGPDYLYDYNLGQLAIRYNLIGICGNQVKHEVSNSDYGESAYAPKFYEFVDSISESEDLAEDINDRVNSR